MCRWVARLCTAHRAWNYIAQDGENSTADSQELDLCIWVGYYQPTKTERGRRIQNHLFWPFQLFIFFLRTMLNDISTIPSNIVSCSSSHKSAWYQSITWALHNPGDNLIWIGKLHMIPLTYSSSWPHSWTLPHTQPAIIRGVSACPLWKQRALSKASFRCKMFAWVCFTLNYC